MSDQNGFVANIFGFKLPDTWYFVTMFIICADFHIKNFQVSKYFLQNFIFVRVEKSLKQHSDQRTLKLETHYFLANTDMEFDQISVCRLIRINLG